MAETFVTEYGKTPLGKIRKQQYLDLMKTYGASFVSALVKGSENAYLSIGKCQIMFHANLDDNGKNSFKFSAITLAQLLKIAKKQKGGLSYTFWHSYNQNKKYYKDFIFFEYVDAEDKSYYYKLNRSTLEIEFDEIRITEEFWKEYQKDIGQTRELNIIK